MTLPTLIFLGHPNPHISLPYVRWKTANELKLSNKLDGLTTPAEAKQRRRRSRKKKLNGNSKTTHIRVNRKLIEIIKYLNTVRNGRKALVVMGLVIKRKCSEPVFREAGG